MMRSRVRNGTLALLLATGAAACGDGHGDEWRGAVRDSAGIEIVSTTGGSVWAGSGGWTVGEDLRIGEVEGAAEYQFGQIAGVDLGSDGRIYVLDQQAQEVRVFDPEGAFLLTIGKAGSGPGELSQAAGPVFVTPGDTVVVPDVILQRITRFTADGQPAGSVPLSMADGVPTRWQKAPSHDLIQQAMVMALPDQPDAVPTTLILRRTPHGELRDTVMELPAGQTVDFSGGQPRMTLFAPEPMWTVGADGGLIHADNSVYRMMVRNERGDLVRILEMHGERQPLTAADQTEFRRIIRRAWEQAGMPPQAMDMMSQALTFADHYPAFADVRAGPAGSLWVQGVQTPQTVAEEGLTFDMQDFGGPSWDVFGDDGRYLGAVRMPPRFSPMTFHGDAIYGVIRDDMDIQYVARVNVSRGALID